MRHLAAFSVLASFMLIGAVPAGAQSANARAEAGAPEQLVNINATADRNTYTERAGRKVQDWKHKLLAFGKKAKAEGSEVGDTAVDDLNEAWTKTEAASQRLRTATAEDWDNAKMSFEAASHGLSDRWRAVNREKK